MTTKELLDSELTAMAEGPFLPQLTDETIADIRRVMADQAPELHDPSSKSVYRKEIFVSVNGQPDVRCLLYGKLNGQEDASGYLHIHGGGYLFGSRGFRPDEFTFSVDTEHCHTIGRLSSGA